MLFQLLSAALEQSTLSEKYKTIYLRTKDILTEQFGGVIENENVQQLYTALVELYDQVCGPTCFSPFALRTAKIQGCFECNRVKGPCINRKLTMRGQNLLSQNNLYSADWLVLSKPCFKQAVNLHAFGCLPTTGLTVHVYFDNICIYVFWLQ